MNVSKIYNEFNDSVSLSRAFSLAIIPFLFFCSRSVFAVDKIAASTESLVSSRIVNVSMGLLFVLFIFFVLAFLLKRMPSLQTAQSGCMNIIDTLYLGSNERILLIQVGQQQILIGANSQKIETLHVLTEAIEIDPAEQKKTFKEQLAGMLSKNTGQGTIEP